MALGVQRRRGGFTLTEVIVVAAVVSILARIALPNLQEAITPARAAAALGDIQVVRTAAAEYYARSNQWPAEAPVGVVPPELVGELPEGFTFERWLYHLDWEALAPSRRSPARVGALLTSWGSRSPPRTRSWATRWPRSRMETVGTAWATATRSW